MIFESIIKEMSLKVSALGIFSKCGGLLHESNASAGDGDGVLLMAQVAPFSGKDMVYVSPSHNDSGVCFFQAQPTQITNQDVYLTQRQNEVIFTGWVNGKKVTKDYGASISETVCAALRSFRPALETGSPVRMVEIELQGIDHSDIGENWGWNRPEFQYNLPPHEAFQIRLRVTTIVSNGCTNQTYHILNPAC